MITNTFFHPASLGGPSPSHAPLRWQVAESIGIENNGEANRADRRKRTTAAKTNLNELHPQDVLQRIVARPLSLSLLLTPSTIIILHSISYYYKLATIHSVILFPIASHNVFICFHSSSLSFVSLPYFFYAMSTAFLSLSMLEWFIFFMTQEEVTRKKIELVG